MRRLFYKVSLVRNRNDGVVDWVNGVHFFQRVLHDFDATDFLIGDFSGQRCGRIIIHRVLSLIGLVSVGTDCVLQIVACRHCLSE